MTDYGNVSAVLLAGGKSSRMGRCKAELPWSGTTLIKFQTEKLRSLGIEDVVISGYSEPVEGGRFAADVYAQKGPLGGIHSGLKAAKHEHCLVLAVDTPLVPKEALAALLGEHISRGNTITVLEQSRGIEPLMGVYDRSLLSLCEKILETEHTSVRELYKIIPLHTVRYDGDEALLLDCNTPEDYRKARKA